MAYKRLAELGAIFLIGDGVIKVTMPSRHGRLWMTRPAILYRGMKMLVDRPLLFRLLGISQIAAGLVLARRQYRDRSAA